MLLKGIHGFYLKEDWIKDLIFLYLFCTWGTVVYERLGVLFFNYLQFSIHDETQAGLTLGVIIIVTLNMNR